MITFRTTFSIGWPFFSYIARRKAGTMASIMTMAAVLTPIRLRRRKNSGTPMAAPAEKQMSWRFVRLKRTFVLILDRSFGTVTYAIDTSDQWAEKMDLARLPVLNREKHRSTVYPRQVQIAVLRSPLTEMV